MGAPKCLAAAALLAACAAQAAEFRNVSAGGPLRHGVYGRIEARGTAAPPLIYKQPVVASQAVGGSHLEPVYLYVPPGQVRKWPQHCHKWKACDLPVLFVRMDDSPSRLGQWKFRPQARQETVARPELLAGPASQSSRR